METFDLICYIFEQTKYFQLGSFSNQDGGDENWYSFKFHPTNAAFHLHIMKGNMKTLNLCLIDMISYLKLEQMKEEMAFVDAKDIDYGSKAEDKEVLQQT